MSKIKAAFILSIISLMMLSCDGLKNTVISLFETSARAKYERQFKSSDSLMTAWKKDFDQAVLNQLEIKDVQIFTVTNLSQTRKALGYLINLKKGDLLTIDATSEIASSKIFIDIFKDSAKVETSDHQLIENGKWTHFVEEGGQYKIVIQPEIEVQKSLALKIYTQPSLYFPVAGKGNKDVQSFWGASRDGGARTHEGLDIFASRGTPVVAAADGYITKTGNQGLGGKQVWLRNQNLGQSLYYAHLDSVMVESGGSVKIGDTLGTVGNTGNAKGGATHLHFGIYMTGGAVDALPFVRIREIPKHTSAKISAFKFLKAASNIRKGPGDEFMIVKTQANQISIQVLAADSNWYHIRTEEGIEGFVSISRLK
ncbi:M23 family metallopeptidase [Chryseobacterium sp. MP_3.2]|uniref:M23 family metallopeptidase n=1 Tax=Chryseobacterium sp. MP_3.2 TaxID=3071712 RepID=UPI002E0BA03A|nr:murein DD-endopeptidase MepM/ murein hydrolase activator NlpD [Chryseobacterium sp. MP_3.2]